MMSTTDMGITKEYGDLTEKTEEEARAEWEEE